MAHIPIYSTDNADAATRQRLSRNVRAGRAIRIAPRLYTRDVTTPVAQQIQANAYHVAGLLYPSGVVGYRTALEGGPKDHGVVFLTHDRPSRELPGIAFQTVPGAPAQPSDMKFAALFV